MHSKLTLNQEQVTPMSDHNKHTILQVTLPLPIRRYFDYLFPENFSDTSLLSIGTRIQVPFGKKKCIGFLAGLSTTSEVPTHKLKSAIAILDRHPIIHPTLFKLIEWASTYYHYPLGEVIKNSLPRKIREDEHLDQSDIHYQNNPQPPNRRPSPTQKKLIEYLAQHPEGLSQRSLRASGFQERTLAALEKQGWIIPMPEAAEKKPEPSTRHSIHNSTPLSLQPDQAKALKAIQYCQAFQTFLLDGVTGSGKTEVYLQAIADRLDAGKQALVLVPEIALTPQTIQRFKARFACKIVVFHSKVLGEEKWHAWHAAASGHASIIIGTRSAIFAPLKKPGIIIVDEEHDPSFRQQSGFRYSARDLAIVRGRLENIPVILGSATPSLESFYNVQQKKFEHLLLTTRANQKPLPNIYLIDVKNQKLKAGLSKPLLDVIEKHLQADNQVLIFLNRRGFSPVLLCHSCGWIAHCKHCDAKMVWHQMPKRLFCHHCNFNAPKPAHCPQCQHTEILMLGAGTERVEEVLTEYFKSYPVIRVDKDSTRQKGAMEKFLHTIQHGKGQILIGTQMLAKGHHFPNLTLVAILDADSGLYSADFKASERMGQLIIQVSGRAGRSEKPGEVYIQTHHPNHPWLQTLIQKNYQTFAEQLMTERQMAELPPFHHLAVIRAEAKNLEQALAFLTNIRTRLKNLKKTDLQISPPLPAWMEKKSNLYRGILMISSPKRPLLHQCLNYFTDHIQTISKSSVNWTLEVDPVEIL